jgi:acetyl-CoA carboxylase carboxyl transferase subunit beta
MNWISGWKKIGIKVKQILKKKKKQPKASEDSLWTSCACQNLISKDELYKNFFICPKCSRHQKISPKNRFRIFFDNGEYELLENPSVPDDMLNFVDTKKYTDRLAAARKLTKQKEAMMVATGKLKGINITVGAQNFNFIGGSLGTTCGEIFIQAVQHSLDHGNPLIFFVCSGGIRMQDSSLGLQQMTRMVLALNELKKTDPPIPYIVILTNPSFGGTFASIGMLGDIIIAEPKAKCGFAGARVIEQTIGETLPEGFQTAEYIKDKCGGIDLVVSRKDLRDTIGNLITVLLKKNKVTSIEATNENQEDPQQITSAAS